MSDTPEQPKSDPVPRAEDEPTLAIRRAGRYVGIGATTAYNRAATGELVPGVPVIRVGAKYRVPTSALRRALGLDTVPVND